MKDILFTTMLAVLLMCYASSAVSCQAEQPRPTLNEFSEALKTKDKSHLIRFVTNEPDYVARKAFDEYSTKYKLTERSVPATSPNDGSLVVSGGDTRAKFVGEQLVTEVIPVDLFFKQNRTITKILEIRENGREAIGRVELEGWSSDNNARYAALLYDVLLYKEKGGWKIFKMILRNKGDESYNDAYQFYANPAKS